MEGLKYYITWFKVGDFKVGRRHKFQVDGAEHRSIYVNTEVDTIFVRVPFATVKWFRETQDKLWFNGMSTCVPSWSPPPCQMALGGIGDIWRKPRRDQPRPRPRPLDPMAREIICVVKKAFNPAIGTRKEMIQVFENLQRLTRKEPVKKLSIAHARMEKENIEAFAWDVVLWDEMWTGLFETAAK
jgi:hypothetical protein